MSLSKFLSLSVVALSFVFCSCETVHDIMRVDPEPVSTFLPHHELLRRQKNDSPFHYTYMCPNIHQYDNYDKLYIAPVNMKWLKNSGKYDEFNELDGGELDKHLDELAVYTHKAVIDKITDSAIPEYMTLVNKPVADRCITLELAITQITPAKGEWNIIGNAVDVVFIGGTFITSQFAYGSLTMEGIFRDAKTGAIIAMFATTEQDEDTVIINVSNFTWMSSAKTNVKNIAGYIAKMFDADDKSQVKHNFPIQWFAY